MGVANSVPPSPPSAHPCAYLGSEGLVDHRLWQGTRVRQRLHIADTKVTGADQVHLCRRLEVRPSDVPERWVVGFVCGWWGLVELVLVADIWWSVDGW